LRSGVPQKNTVARLKLNVFNPANIWPPKTVLAAYATGSNRSNRLSTKVDVEAIQTSKIYIIRNWA